MVATEGSSPLFLPEGMTSLSAICGRGDALSAQGAGVVGHVVVDDLGAPAVTAALAGGCLALQGLLPDVLALGLGHAGKNANRAAP
ncbi:hypothetical protein [Streptomyces turgidiscabies]|uniref:Uncharacterized protein n=1 Tax=Streptomyces turgidiscabies TaxID=85558 RepID=A0ABU0S0C7_9ACTN|nr:hypothetical protein [Streptomyces turgidiscabies]MDQ0936600.1 hypothetical protein [Streptomyces turgidiscabies]